MLKQTLIFMAILTVPFLWVPFVINYENFTLHSGTIGPAVAMTDLVVESEHGVPVYALDTKSAQNLAESRSDDGYLYGEKWQCTEFIRRYYHEKHGIKMPDELIFGKSYFEPSLPHGAINPKLGMVQFKNGNDKRPSPGDLLVFTDGECGNIAIVSIVKESSIEIVQQNAEDNKPRETLALVRKDNGWLVEGKSCPAGWLHLPSIR